MAQQMNDLPAKLSAGLHPSDDGKRTQLLHVYVIL